MRIRFNRIESNTYITNLGALIILSCLLYSHVSFAQFQANFSSNCENGNCTTIICINDNPCKTTNSNSRNITSLDNLLQNDTVPGPNLQAEII